VAMAERRFAASLCISIMHHQPARSGLPIWLILRTPRPNREMAGFTTKHSFRDPPDLRRNHKGGPHLCLQRVANWAQEPHYLFPRVRRAFGPALSTCRHRALKPIEKLEPCTIRRVA
jgi:hypothetical protein